MGQLIAYAAGLEAGTVIWVTHKIRDEHRLAIEWLNKIANEHVSFFLVRMDVIRIGESPYAVQFFLEAKPSQFERTLKRIEQRAAAVRPVSMVWGDNPDNRLTVSSWREVFWKTLERADKEKFELQKLRAIRTTLDEAEATEFNAARYFDAQNIYVEMNGSKDQLLRRIGSILQFMQKPKGFLHIEQDDGTEFDTPQ